MNTIDNTRHLKFMEVRPKAPFDFFKMLEGEREVFNFSIAIDPIISDKIDFITSLVEEDSLNNKLIWIMLVDEDFTFKEVIKTLKQGPIILHKTNYNEEHQITGISSTKLKGLIDVYAISNTEEQRTSYPLYVVLEFESQLIASTIGVQNEHNNNK